VTDEAKLDFERRLANVMEGFCPYCNCHLEPAQIPHGVSWNRGWPDLGLLNSQSQVEDERDAGRCSCCGALFAGVTDPEWPGWLCFGSADCQHMRTLLEGFSDSSSHISTTNHSTSQQNIKHAPASRWP
jgi:hypothetical protein